MSVHPFPDLLTLPALQRQAEANAKELLQREEEAHAPPVLWNTLSRPEQRRRIQVQLHLIADLRRSAAQDACLRLLAEASCLQVPFLHKMLLPDLLPTSGAAKTGAHLAGVDPVLFTDAAPPIRLARMLRRALSPYAQDST